MWIQRSPLSSTVATAGAATSPGDSGGVPGRVGRGRRGRMAPSRLRRSSRAPLFVGIVPRSLQGAHRRAPAPVYARGLVDGIRKGDDAVANPYHRVTMTDERRVPAPGGAQLPLRRTTFAQPDGRQIHVYGEVRGAPPADAPRSEPTALHLRRDELSGSWVAVSPARNVRPHSSAPSGGGMVARQPGGAVPLSALPGRPGARLRLRGRGLRQPLPDVHARSAGPARPGRPAVRPVAGRLRGRHVHRAPRGRLRDPDAGGDRPRRRRLARPDRGPLVGRAARLRPSLRESRRRGGGHAVAPPRPDLRLRARPALDRAARHGARGGPGANGVVRLLRGGRRRAALRSPRPRRSPLGGRRPLRPALAVRGARAGGPPRSPAADRSDGRGVAGARRVAPRGRRTLQRALRLRAPLHDGRATRRRGEPRTGTSRWSSIRPIVRRD